MRLPPYPSYKPSGVEWLGDVPEHWEVKRSDAAISTTKRQISPEVFAGAEVMHYSIPAVQETGAGVVENGEDIASAKQLIDRPVVLVSRLNPRKATICRAVPHGELMTIASTEFVALQPISGDIRFLEYLVSSELFRQRLDSCVQSVTRSHQRARPGEISRFWSAWPKVEEQRTIAKFLDRETAKIDALLAKNQKFVERLREKRTALISYTVTRGLPPAAARAAGLDPHPKLRPSGIDWLGDVPEHWLVAAVRRRAVRLQTGTTPPTSEERYYEDGTVPWYGPSSFDEQIVLTRPIKLIHISAVEDGVAREFAPGSTFVVTIGATLGKVGAIQAVSSCNQQITAIQFESRRVHARFATYQLKRLEQSLRAIAPSATLPILDQDEIANLFLALPSCAEQAAISDFLDCETARIDSMVAKVEMVTERMQEYRSTMITAAVTGKIDVRGAVA